MRVGSRVRITFCNAEPPVFTIPINTCNNKATSKNPPALVCRNCRVRRVFIFVAGLLEFGQPCICLDCILRKLYQTNIRKIAKRQQLTDRGRATSCSQDLKTNGLRGLFIHAKPLQFLKESRV
jgi:hypothetical protein